MKKSKPLYVYMIEVRQNRTRDFRHVAAPDVISAIEFAMTELHGTVTEVKLVVEIDRLTQVKKWKV